jgi:hypothetical protein
MKKLVLPLIIIVLLFWVLNDKCNNSSNNNKLTKEFKRKQDSLNYVIDSLKFDIVKKDSTIYELYKKDVELNYLLMHQEEKIKYITKYVDSSKDKIDKYSAPELVSSLNQRYPKDTTNTPLLIAKPVLQASAKDLAELDGAREIIIVKDSIISLTQEKVVIRDSVIVEFENKEVNYKIVDSIKTTQIGDWKVQYKVAQKENEKLKFQKKFSKLMGSIIAAVLAFLYISK